MIANEVTLKKRPNDTGINNYTATLWPSTMSKANTA